MSEREKEFLVSTEVSRLCTRGDGSHGQGWAKTGGESSQGEEGQRGRAAERCKFKTWGAR